MTSNILKLKTCFYSCEKDALHIDVRFVADIKYNIK